MLIMLLCKLDMHAQQVYVGGQRHNGVLTWNDFSGKVPSETRFYANTSVKVVPRMRHAVGPSGSLVLEWLDVRVEVDSVNTWSRPEKRTDALLQHEQGHLSLFVLWARELNFSISKASFTRKNLQKGLDELMKEVAEKYKALNARYDGETEHMRNREKQAEWTKWIDEQIAGGGYSQSGPPD